MESLNFFFNFFKDPIVTCPDIQLVVDNDPGECSAFAEFCSPEAYDNCGEITYEATLDGTTTVITSGNYEFPVGATDIVHTVADVADTPNEVTCDVEVVVLDTEVRQTLQSVSIVKIIKYCEIVTLIII